MVPKLRFASDFGAVLAVLLTIIPARAQQYRSGSPARAVITSNIDEGNLAELSGNTRAEAKAENDRGEVPDNLEMEHMLLQLRRSPEQEQELQQYLNDLQTNGSPNFHQWITAQEFGARFGLAKQDLDTITRWLESHGLKVNVVYPSGMVIDFSGTAHQVREAFKTEIHYLEVNGEHHVTNMKDPRLPTALASAIVGIVSLHDFKPHTMHQMRLALPKYMSNGSKGDTSAVVPADLAKIYNLNPLFSAGYSGQGQTIVVIEDTSVFNTSDWKTFRSKLGLSSYTSGTFSTTYPAPPNGPNNCSRPRVIAPNDAEAILDAEWASAAAPSAAIEMATCADTTTTFGGLIALQNLINSASQPPAIMSISYGQCETLNGPAANAAYNSAYQQAVAEGVSIFVSSGDSGAAGCDNDDSEATHGVDVNGLAGTPYNVAVGGTDFSDTYSGTNSNYWNSTHASSYGSALSYIPEIPWNDSCAGALLSSHEGYATPYGRNGFCSSFTGEFFRTTVAAGGGPSECATGIPSSSRDVSGSCKGWPKPSWQSVPGNPRDGVRDTPDISLFAANGLWGHYYVFCWSNTAHGGAACSGAPTGWSGAGGTSFSSPIMAGIQALVNQRAGDRQGNPNPVYYQLAASEYSSSAASSCNSSNGSLIADSCIFYDVTQGDIDVNCDGKDNCYRPSGPVGVLSTSDRLYSAAYGTSTGWDFATGIGSVNAANLVNNWPSLTPSYTLSASPNSLPLTQGSSGTITITVNDQNGFSGNVTLSASGLPSGVTASFSPNDASSASMLTLTASDTATVGTATVTITGTSGSQTNDTTISLTVNSLGNYTLSASPSSLSIAQGTSDTSSITITPQGGFSRGVTLSASGLPNGVTAIFNPNPATSTSTLTLLVASTATPGTATVTVSGTCCSLTNTSTLSLTVTPSLTLPSGWVDGDIGSVGPAGSATYTGGTFTVNASGSFIWGTADGFNFAYQPWVGDATMVARVVSLHGGASSESAGVMIRETLGAGSTNVYTAFGGGGLIYFDERASTGGNSTSQSSSSSVTLPYWVKLVRSGNTFRGYISPDGVNWVQVGTTQTIAMAQGVYVGLAVSGNDNSTLATSTFDNVSISSVAAPAPVISGVSPNTGMVGSQAVISGSGFGASQGNSTVTLNGAPVTINSWSAPSITITIPSGATSGPLVVSVGPSMDKTNPVTFTVAATQPTVWQDRDLGSVGPAGSMGYANGTFAVNASGSFIWGTADGFNFAYQPLQGDGTMVARVVSLHGGASSESAGVMIRETLTTGSTNVYTAFGGGGLIYFDERASTGGNSTSQSSSGSVTLPYWVKLVRSGNTFNGYISPDGVTWVQVGTTQTVNMAQGVYIGLAVSADSNSVLATSTFDNVSISSAAAPAPVITGVSPNAGMVGSQAVISGSGFGASQGSSMVTLNGALATINSWSATSITITIPTGATTGPLAVSVAPTLNSSNPVTFTVTASQ